ncbi:hypothetical protein ACLMJK_004710 [Lecanora helva]
MERALDDKKESTKRTLRSNATRSVSPAPRSMTVNSPMSFTVPSPLAAATRVKLISHGSELPDLTKAELTLLRRKQKKLARNALSTLCNLPPGIHISNALASTLIFAQEFAGTAVCIDPAGWILTCSHCISEDEGAYRADNKRRWLLFYTGLAVQVKCHAWDTKRDLALLKIIAVESADDGKPGEMPTFRHVQLSSSIPSAMANIICIGQPGADDLESVKARKTKYNLVEVSKGNLRGMIRNADPQDNSEIGALMHDAWTYWGHSGAPLLKAKDGNLVGLHSSWDAETLTRHGIPLIAIQQFLQKYLPSAACFQAAISEDAVSRGQPGADGAENMRIQKETSNRGQSKRSKREPSLIILDDED